MTIKKLCVAASMLFLAACSSSTENLENPEPINPREGVNYQVKLASKVDGETISFTVMEPQLVADNLTSPLILHSHGYAGSRATSPSGGMLGGLHNAGFGFISLDERGNGESGGVIRVLDPRLEGQDWLQVLDWAEDNLNWMRFEDGNKNRVAKSDSNANPVIGAVGGSYGGGYQHMIWAIDPKRRLDALAPDITWHDLRYSIVPGNVFKSMWAGLLAAGGLIPPNRSDQSIILGALQGPLTNTVDPQTYEMFYHNSPASHCVGDNPYTVEGGLQAIDVFYTQSAQDTLFNLNEAVGNYQCLKDLGGDVRFFTKSVGHGLNNGDSSDECAGLSRVDATVAWYQEKLLGIKDAADIVPPVCLQLGAEKGDSLVMEALPEANHEPVAVPSWPVTVAPLSVTTVSDLVGTITSFLPRSPLDFILGIPDALNDGLNLLTGGALGQRIDVLYDAASQGPNVVAGIPLIDIRISNHILPAIDPVIFVGLGVRNGPLGHVRILHDQMTPFRGYQEALGAELPGVLERLNGNEQLVLVMQGDYTPHYILSSTLIPGQVGVQADVYLPLLGDTASYESVAMESLTP